jgi:hypothetical protein
MVWTIGALNVQNSALVGALILDFAIQWVRRLFSKPSINSRQTHACLYEMMQFTVSTVIS